MNIEFGELTKSIADKLTKDEVSMKASYQYAVEINRFGIDAVAHCCVMQKSLDVSNGLISADGFAQKYELDFKKDPRCGFVMPLKRLEEEGLYVPKHAYWDPVGTPYKRNVHLFDRDYLELLKDIPLTDTLVNRRWHASDFEDKELVIDALAFAADFWLSRAERYLKFPGKQSQDVVYLGGKLVQYYTDVVSALLQSTVQDALLRGQAPLVEKLL
jgi:hypothetical protein